MKKVVVAGLMAVATATGMANAFEVGDYKVNVGADLGYRYVSNTGGGAAADFEFKPSSFNVFNPYVKVSRGNWFTKAGFGYFKGDDAYVLFPKGVFSAPDVYEAELTHKNIELSGGYAFKGVMKDTDIEVFGAVGKDSFKIAFKDPADSLTEKATYIKVGATVNYRLLYATGYIGKTISASTTLQGEEMEKKGRYGLEVGSRFNTGRTVLKVGLYAHNIDMSYKTAKNEYFIYGFTGGFEW